MAHYMDIFEKEVSEFCRHATVWEFDFNLHISLRHRFLYTETPKAACSTIKMALQRIELDAPELTRENIQDIHNRDLSPLLKPSQVRPFDTFMARDDIFKFCFVRNPFSRLLSSYLNKIQGDMPEKALILTRLGKDAANLREEVSFREFIEVIHRQSPREMNPHWRPQYYQTFQKQIDYDFIGKFEMLDTDLPHALSTITPDYKQYITNELSHATGAGDLLDTYYTPELIETAHDIYAIDFEYFGYDSKLIPA